MTLNFQPQLSATEARLNLKDYLKTTISLHHNQRYDSRELQDGHAQLSPTPYGSKCSLLGVPSSMPEKLSHHVKLRSWNP
jgi:hypothetical protein